MSLPHPQPLDSLAWQKDGQKFVSAHSDSSIYYWSVSNSSPNEGPTHYYGEVVWGGRGQWGREGENGGREGREGGKNISRREGEDGGRGRGEHLKEGGGGENISRGEHLKEG